jgi:predicted Zn-dependent protease
MEQMKRTADHGHYLQPFAKILLALAYEREHQMDRARVLLAELASEFPANPLYARELALIDHSPAP